MTIGIRKWQYIDEKHAFDYWIKYDTLKLAWEQLCQDYPNEMMNPHTGNFVHLHKVESAAMRYLLSEPDVARPFVQEAWANKGYILSNDNWNRLLVTYAHRALNKKQADLYIKKHHLENYKKLERTVDVRRWSN